MPSIVPALNFIVEEMKKEEAAKKAKIVVLSKKRIARPLCEYCGSPFHEQQLRCNSCGAPLR
jgi:Zn finger protein HypA/HybF involved in hydrogenase expression